MSLKATDVAELSRLLDQALALAPAQLDEWLAALPAQQAHLRPRLQRLLHERTARGGFLDAGPALDADDPSIAHAGDAVGPYRLLHELGRGGMGSVWLAERSDGGLKRKVALKLPRLAWGAGLAERMARERDIGALLEHPQIARLYDAGVDAPGRPFLAFEFIDGLPLDRWCREQGLSIAQRLQLFVQVTRAVAYAHARLVVHRDLKPSNVLVDADGRAHLLDFGIAKLLDDSTGAEITREQGRVLTPHYASPEQIEGGPITVATDVYSLGVLLYELLTSRRPHEPRRDSAGALEEAILGTEPAPASSRAATPTDAKALRGELDAIVGKALKRDPAARYATADALADDVERHLHGQPVRAKPDNWTERTARIWRQHRLGISAAGALTIAIVGGLAASTVLYLRADRAYAEALRQAELAKAVNSFLTDDLLGGADPLTSGRKDLPASELLKRASESAGVRFADKPQLEASVLATIGNAYSSLSEYQAGERALKRAIKLVEGQVLADEATQFRLALLEMYLRAERIDDAREQVKLLEASPPQAPEELLHLDSAKAWIDYREGNQARAIASFESMRPGFEALRESQPAQALAFARRLANAYLNDGRLEEAAKLFRQVLARETELYGQRDARSVSTMLSIVQVLELQGRPEEALTEVMQARRIAKETLGEEQEVSLFVEGELANVYVDLKRYDEAEAIYRRVLALRMRRDGEENLSTRLAASNLGNLLISKKQYPEALDVYLRLYEVERKLGLGATRGTMINAYQIGVTYGRMQRWSDALAWHQKNFELSHTALSPDDWQRGAIQNQLAIALANLGRRDEARRHFDEAISLLRRTVGESNPFTQRAIDARKKFVEDAPS